MNLIIVIRTANGVSNWPKPQTFFGKRPPSAAGAHGGVLGTCPRGARGTLRGRQAGGRSQNVPGGGGGGPGTWGPWLEVKPWSLWVSANWDVFVKSWRSNRATVDDLIWNLPPLGVQNLFNMWAVLIHWTSTLAALATCLGHGLAGVSVYTSENGCKYLFK